MKNYVIWGYVILLFLLPLSMPVFANQKAHETKFQQQSDSVISIGEKRMGKELPYFHTFKAKKGRAKKSFAFHWVMASLGCFVGSLVLTGIAILSVGAYAVGAVVASMLVLVIGFFFLLQAWFEYKLVPEFKKGKKLIDVSVFIGLLSLIALFTVDGMVLLSALKIYGLIFVILFEIFVRWR